MSKPFRCKQANAITASGWCVCMSLPQPLAPFPPFQPFTSFFQPFPPSPPFPLLTLFPLRASVAAAFGVGKSAQNPRRPSTPIPQLFFRLKQRVGRARARKGWRVLCENGVCFLPTSQRVRIISTCKNTHRLETPTQRFGEPSDELANFPARPEASIAVKIPTRQGTSEEHTPLKF